VNLVSVRPQNALLSGLATLLIAGVTWSEARADTPLGTDWVYQGRLTLNGEPVPPGNVNLMFQLFDAAVGGNLEATDNVGAWPVQEGGLVSVPLDFGGTPFNTGEQRWLQITVNGNVLSPRQLITPAPFALYALNAGSIGIINALDAADGSPVDAVYVDNSGNVGIGDTTPLGRLHVVAQVLEILPAALENDDLIVEAQDATLGLYSTSQGTWGSAIALKEVNAGAIVDTWGIARKTTAAAAPSALAFTYGPDANYAINPAMMTIDALGNVGIGTSSPARRLHVVGNSTANGWLNVGNALEPEMEIHAFDSSGACGIKVDSGDSTASYWMESGNGTPRRMYAPTASSDVRIQINGTDQLWVQETGTTSVRVLEIIGGSDLAEGFSVNGDAKEPGMVVSIDPANPGQLIAATHAYDKRVAGVISGAGGVNPGMVMGQKDSIADGKHPVALTGRVYVWVDASYGKVEPGDLLTTSDTRGHAMKVGDASRSAGAVIGKAMTSLENGRGLVLVLVSLQ
jgi:hypothetical protein